jgi:hypothetical protein
MQASFINQKVFIYLPSTRQSTAKIMPNTTVNLERTASLPLVLPPATASAPPPIAEPMPGCLDSWATTTTINKIDTNNVVPIKKYFTVNPPLYPLFQYLKADTALLKIINLTLTFILYYSCMRVNTNTIIPVKNTMYCFTWCMIIAGSTAVYFLPLSLSSFS